MLDKLMLKIYISHENDGPLEKLIKTKFDFLKYRIIYDHYYTESYQLTSESYSYSFILKSMPKFQITNHIKVELNPSGFKSFYIIEDLIKLIPYQHIEIDRIDFSIDLCMSLEEIYASLIIPRKRLKIKYQNLNEIETIYYGNRPEVIIIYQKKSIKKVRLELRLSKSKIPIKDFLKIVSLSQP